MGKTNGHGSSTTKVEVEERVLPVKLTEGELLERGTQAADAQVDVDKLKAQRTALGGELKAAEGRRSELLETIERGTEDRRVRCHWVEDWPKNVWRLVRQDSGESVDTRAMTAQDHQSTLPLDGAEEAYPRTQDELVDELHSTALRLGGKLELGAVELVDVGDQRIEFAGPKPKRAKATKATRRSAAIAQQNAQLVNGTLGVEGVLKRRHKAALKPKSTPKKRSSRNEKHAHA